MAGLSFAIAVMVHVPVATTGVAITGYHVAITCLLETLAITCLLEQVSKFSAAELGTLSS